jgi:hypothetical protein
VAGEQQFLRVIVASAKTRVFLQAKLCTKHILTIILLMRKIRRAPNNAGKWQMRFNLVFKSLKFSELIASGARLNTLEV